MGTFLSTYHDVREICSKAPKTAGAVVFRDGKKPTTVKNLAWLIGHWQSVKFINMAAVIGSGPNYAGYLEVTLRDGTIYATDWASYHHLFEWLDRPVFRGCDVYAQNGDRRGNCKVGDSTFKMLEGYEAPRKP